MAERLTATERREREDKALAMWHRGCSFGEIAEKHGFANRSGAKKAVERARDRHGRPEMDRQKARERDIERLEVLLRAYWPKAKAGNLDAAREVRQIMRQRASLLGLVISPQSLILAGEGGGPDEDDEETRKGNVTEPSELERLRRERDDVKRRGYGTA